MYCDSVYSFGATTIKSECFFMTLSLSCDQLECGAVDFTDEGKKNLNVSQFHSFNCYTIYYIIHCYITVD